MKGIGSLIEMKALAIVAALGSAASWAIGAVLFARLCSDLNPVALTLAKSIVGVAFLGISILGRGWGLAPSLDLLRLTLSGVLGIAVADALFFAALKRLGASTVVLLFVLGQVLTVVLAVLWLHERPSVVQWVGIAMITMSVAVTLWLRRDPDNTRTQAAGILFGLGAILSMSVSVIIAKEALEMADALEATFIRMLAAMGGIGLWASIRGQLWSGLAPLLDPKLAWRLAVAVAVVTFGGFWLSLVAVKHLEVSVAITLNSTEPLFVLPLAAVLLREKVTTAVVACALVAVLGVGLLCFSL